MDRSVLAARIQEILKARPKPAAPEPALLHVPDEEAAFAARCASDEAASEAVAVLGGTTVDGPAGRCVVVEREYATSHPHGRHDVARYSEAAGRGLPVLPWFLSAPRRAGTPESGPGDEALPLGAEQRLLFFDLETTGLSGGAGTYAFLVGCGYFDGGAFRTRQFFLRGYGEERALLEAVRGFLDGGEAADSCLVTYNGRAFDLPLIETRYLFHRCASPFAALPHVDMLSAARRLWRRRPTAAPTGGDGYAGRGVAPVPADLRASCALTALEQDILGLRRDDDVPGWEIPARFFAYARTGDARGLVAVMEHNRLDLLSLAAVTALILEQVLEPDRVARDRCGCLALARLLEYLGRLSGAERCYERASEPDGLIEGEWDRLARAEALHWLALHHRRSRRFADAAQAWRGLLQIPGIGEDLRREACEALAIHHEHRAKDLDAARSFALRALDLSRGGRFAPAVEHRLDRLSRKIGVRQPIETGMPAQPAFPIDE